MYFMKIIQNYVYVFGTSQLKLQRSGIIALWRSGLAGFNSGGVREGTIVSQIDLYYRKIKPDLVLSSFYKRNYEYNSRVPMSYLTEDSDAVPFQANQGQGF